jgi:hypothetical protein
MPKTMKKRTSKKRTMKHLTEWTKTVKEVWAQNKGKTNYTFKQALKDAKLVYDKNKK